MIDEINEALGMAEQTQEQIPPLPHAEKYPRSELISGSRTIFGVMPEVVAGALHGIEAEELTLTEVKAAIDNFLKRRVK